MRARVVLLLGVIGCGRIGYDAVGDDVVAPIDAIDAIPIQGAAACNVPVDLMTLPVPAGQTIRALELGATDAGFIAVWTFDGGIWATGLSVSDLGGGLPQLLSIQDGEAVVDWSSDDLAIDSNGNRAVLAISDNPANRLEFHPLDERGLWRASEKLEGSLQAHGHDFIVADPDELLFGVAAGDGTNAVALEREIDSHPQSGPIVTIGDLVPETTGIAKLGEGYVVLEGRESQCDLIAVDDFAQPVGTSQVMSMTCHNAQIASTGDNQVVAAWNCNDQQVWITGGAMDADLTGYRSYWGTDGDTANAASNPRLAIGDDGVWYGFQVEGGRLGRGLVHADGSNDDRVSPDVIVGGGVETYDLAAHGGHAFLFWTSGDHLWTEQLCAPP